MFQPPITFKFAHRFGGFLGFERQPYHHAQNRIVVRLKELKFQLLPFSKSLRERIHGVCK